MKKALFLFLVLLLPSISAIELGSFLEDARQHSQDYESDIINYLQLKVYLNFLKEQAYGAFFGNEFRNNAPEQDSVLFDYFSQMERAYNDGDFETVYRLIDLSIREFEKENHREAIAALNELKAAIRENDEARIEKTVGKLENFLKEEKRSNEFKGWTQEKVGAFFGEPTGQQDRVWSENLKRDVKLKEPVLYWQKIVFNGQKIKVMFNAWPHIEEQENTLEAYYWVDFEVRFKKDTQSPNSSKLKSELKQKINAFYQTGSGGPELASYLVQNERELNDLLSENATMCEQVMTDFFGKPSGTSEKIEWSGTLFEGEFDVEWKLNETTDNQWHGFYTWIEITPSEQNENASLEPVDRDEIIGLEVPRLRDETKKLVEQIQQESLAKNIPEIREKESRLKEYINVLTDKANNEVDQFGITDLQAFYESLFGEYTTDFTKEFLTSVDFKENLFRITKEQTNAYCRGENQWCGDGFSCSNAQCVSAQGGNETCDNRIDDDSDRIVDCQDPDCIMFLACGKICEPACSGENGCWPCTTENCRPACDACSECNQANPQNPEQCNNVCSACGTCNNNSCASRCESCWRCENEYFGDGCFDECTTCNQCNQNPGNDCGTQCVTCNTCRFDAGQFFCQAGEIFSRENGWCETPVQEPPPPEQDPQAQPPPECTISCSPEQVLDTQTCQCQEPVQGGGLLGLPLFPSMATGFAVLGESVSAPNPNQCDQITCSVNQSCNPQQGYCECTQGFWDCDGDWVNGCESTAQCSPCQSDLDCAQPRCSADYFSVETFKCEQGEKWTETIAEFDLGGNCEKKTSGELQTAVWINGWGEKFNELQQLKDQAYLRSESDWCQKELDSSITERLELQKSFNDAFLDWFFNEFVLKNPDQFRFHEESLRIVYDSFSQNADSTARSLRCLERNDWPREAVAVSLSLNTPNGKMRFWEELKQTTVWGPNQDILSPYMEIWVFPSKEQFKEILREEVVNEGPKGPTAIEKEMMRKDPRVMQTIERMSNTFGGEAKILLEIKDNTEIVLVMALTVDTESLVQMEFLQQRPPQEQIDAVISISYDFFYDTMSTLIKDVQGSRIVRPHWEENQFEVSELDDGFIMIGLFTKIILAIPTGQVQVEPLSAIPGVVLTFADMIGLMQLK